MGEDRVQNGVDSKVFWMGMYGTFGLWLAFIFISLFSLSFSSLSICIVALTLTFVNLMGYQRCEKNHKSQVSGFLVNAAKKNITAD